MKVGIFVLILTTRGLVHGVPLNHKEPILEALEPIEETHGESSHKLVKKSTSELCPLDIEEDCGNSRKSEDTQVYQGFNRLSLPTSDTTDSVAANVPHETSYLGQNIHDILTPFEFKTRLPNMLPLPLVWNQQWTPYESDRTETSGFDVGNYGSPVYPYLQADMFASMNHVPSVSYLPPVYSTHIHETIPADHASYDIDDLNSQEEILLPNVRPVRSRLDDDFLAELSHDAMLNNILPTMPVPFVRNVMSMYPSPHAVGGLRGSMLAVYPNAVPANCAVPFLFNCSPKIARGTLAENTYADLQQLVAPAAMSGAYRTAQHLFTNDNLMELPMDFV